jgi:hypothetical protein
LQTSSAKLKLRWTASGKQVSSITKQEFSETKVFDCNDSTPARLSLLSQSNLVRLNSIIKQSSVKRSDSGFSQYKLVSLCKQSNVSDLLLKMSMQSPKPMLMEEDLDFRQFNLPQALMHSRKFSNLDLLADEEI